jgi:hypothetical protein
LAAERPPSAPPEVRERELKSGPQTEDGEPAWLLRSGSREAWIVERTTGAVLAHLRSRDDKGGFPYFDDGQAVIQVGSSKCKASVAHRLSVTSCGGKWILIAPSLGATYALDAQGKVLERVPFQKEKHVVKERPLGGVYRLGGKFATVTLDVVMYE